MAHRPSRVPPSAPSGLRAVAAAVLVAGSLAAGAADKDLDGIVDLFDPDYLSQPINVARLPLQHAITVVHGRGERVLYTFEDPQCGYCRELGRRLAEIGNVTVHTWVVALLGEPSGELAGRAWCAPDRAAGWQAVMARQYVPAARDGCAAPLAKTTLLAEMLGVNFTPTVFFADGTRMVGLKPQAEIEARLRSAQARLAQ